MVRGLTSRISRRDFVKITDTALVLSSIPVSINVASSIRQPNARDFGDLDDPESSISRRVRESTTIRLREELGTKPRNVVVLRGG
jgi:Fe-S-cluster-containing dehydrogenase component